ncbi:MAG: 50S ribosomal protein L18 [Deltaproteobacteria bacterium]|nr:50S ribosomal protein L18 [Deltaproteobacteria bacterium]
MLRKEKEEGRRRRKMRTVAKLRGTGQKPRLCVFKSARHIYAQLIDDEQGRTLVAASSRSPEIRAGERGPGKLEIARRVGDLVSARALDRSIRRVVFDRNGFLYHGRVKALAEAAREKGLDF